MLADAKDGNRGLLSVFFGSLLQRPRSDASLPQWSCSMLFFVLVSFGFNFDEGRHIFSQHVRMCTVGNCNNVTFCNTCRKKSVAHFLITHLSHLWYHDHHNTYVVAICNQQNDLSQNVPTHCRFLFCTISHSNANEQLSWNFVFSCYIQLLLPNIGMKQEAIKRYNTRRNVLLIKTE